MRAPVWTADLPGDPRFGGSRNALALFKTEGIRAVLAAPVILGEDVWGILGICIRAGVPVQPRGGPVRRRGGAAGGDRHRQREAVRRPPVRLRAARGRAGAGGADGEARSPGADGGRRGPRLQQPPRRHPRTGGAPAAADVGSARSCRASRSSRARRWTGPRRSGGSWGSRAPRARSRRSRSRSRRCSSRSWRSPVRAGRTRRRRAALFINVALALEPVPPVRGNAAELREVFLNVLLNAVDAMPAGGTVTLGVRSVEPGDGPEDALGETVECFVRDTGVGMSSEVRRRAFDPFFTTKGARGTGLGLSVVYGIVSRHGGRVRIDSRENVGDDGHPESPGLLRAARDAGAGAGARRDRQRAHPRGRRRGGARPDAGGHPAPRRWPRRGGR